MTDRYKETVERIDVYMNTCHARIERDMKDMIEKAMLFNLDKSSFHVELPERLKKLGFMSFDLSLIYAEERYLVIDKAYITFDALWFCKDYISESVALPIYSFEVISLDDSVKEIDSVDLQVLLHKMVHLNCRLRFKENEFIKIHAYWSSEFEKVLKVFSYIEPCKIDKVLYNTAVFGKNIDDNMIVFLKFLFDKYDFDTIDFDIFCSARYVPSDEFMSNLYNTFLEVADDILSKKSNMVCRIRNDLILSECIKGLQDNKLGIRIKTESEWDDSYILI